MTQELIFTNKVAETLDKTAEALNPKGVFVLVDFNTASFVLPRLKAESATVANAEIITIKAGDVNKNLDSLQTIWKRLTDGGCTRDSLLINLGGGVVTDIGAFAASTFKRGIKFINIPTTLLGAVDASVGGKTGINFNNLKNHIGLFSNADLVIISTTYFNTLNDEELRSGYAEMLKHALLTSKSELDSLIDRDVTETDPEELLVLLKKSVMVKKDVVDADPTEQGLRRRLNLGHTIGHALESLALQRKRPIPHGYAVAYGLIGAMVLSHIKLGFPSDTLHRVSKYIVKQYGIFDFTCDDYPTLLSFMAQDKKNKTAGEVNFTLLKEAGEPETDCVVADSDIRNALDIMRDLMGI